MFMEMSTLFWKKIKKFLSLFLWLFALGNDRINEVVFQKEKSGMEGIALDKTAECKLVLDTAVLAGKIMLQSGAEIHRVEDTIHRILKVSGMKTAEAFVMPTGLIVTLDDPRMDSMTVVKRIKTRGTNLSRIAEVNDISRRFCSGNIVSILIKKDAVSGGIPENIVGIAVLIGTADQLQPEVLRSEQTFRRLGGKERAVQFLTVSGLLDGFFYCLADFFDIKRF